MSDYEAPERSFVLGTMTHRLKTTHPEANMSGMQRDFTGEALGPGPVSWTVEVTGPNPAQAFQVGVQCTHMPTDGQVAFTLASPGAPVPPVSVPKTRITSPDMMLMAQVGDWPGGAQSTVTVEYWQGATPPPPGSSIQVVMFIMAGQ